MKHSTVLNSFFKSFQITETNNYREYYCSLEYRVGIVLDSRIHHYSRCIDCIGFRMSSYNNRIFYYKIHHLQRSTWSILKLVCLLVQHKAFSFTPLLAVSAENRSYKSPFIKCSRKINVMPGNKTLPQKWR